MGVYCKILSAFLYIQKNFIIKRWEKIHAALNDLIHFFLYRI